MAKMKKIFMPIAIGFGAVAAIFLVLTIVISIMAKTSGKASKTTTAVDTQAEDGSSYELVTGYGLDDFSADSGFFSGKAGAKTEEAEDSADLEDSEGYILPDSDSVELTESDLEDLSAKELCYARNEIYARYGYVFDSDELNEYFEGKDWYEADSSASTSDISELEEKNANFILQYQKDNDLEYKPE